MTDKKIYTLTQFNSSIERFITKHLGSLNFWVVAEIAKINQKNGHRYIELVDSIDGKTTAIMSANLWSSSYSSILYKIVDDLPNILKVGNKVLFLLKVEFHKVYGLKVIVNDIDPSFSHGEIERKKQETIKRLKDEGLFDLQKDLYLPIIAKKVALIGSPGTSGYRDFIDELQNNQVYRNFKVREFAASVQGDKATLEIIKSLKEARTYDFDVIVIIRGGGSKMDLNLFNDYELSKEICLTKIPIMTGIGHETDEVVADLVCKKTFITPTAVAKHLYVQIGVFGADLRNAYDSVKQNAISQLGAEKEEFNHACKYLVHYSQQLIFQSNQEIQNESRKLQVGFFEIIGNERSLLDLQLNKAVTSSINSISVAMDIDLPSRLERLLILSSNLVHHTSIELNNIEEILNLLNPKKLLQNGYTISTIDGKDALLVTDELIGKEMRTLTNNKIITSTITKTENQ